MDESMVYCIRVLLVLQDVIKKVKEISVKFKISQRLLKLYGCINSLVSSGIFVTKFFPKYK